MVKSAFMLPLLACIAACLIPRSPAQQIVDGETLIACVETDWGQPIGTIAADCTGGALTVAEDAVADVEILFEGSSDAGTGVTLTSFPYKDNPNIVAKVNAKNAAHQHK
jgi:hypothetical protein